jgi:hypothetical protein
VIVPTVGRETLERTLKSLVPQLGDDLCVVAIDCVGEEAVRCEGMVRAFGMTPHQVGSLTPWGHHACNAVLDVLPNGVTHTWRVDDDDVATPGALEALRWGAGPRPVFARFRYVGTEDNLIWIRPAMGLGNIGSPCILAPRSQSRWGDRYEGDFDYAADLVDELGDPVWLDRVVAEVHLSR